MYIYTHENISPKEDVLVWLVPRDGSTPERVIVEKGRASRCCFVLNVLNLNRTVVIVKEGFELVVV